MGHRVELGELETHAMACPGVKNAVALTFTEDGSDFASIALAVVGPPGVGADLKPVLAARLPGFMLPKRIFEVDAVPTTRVRQGRQAAPGRPRRGSAAAVRSV